MANSEIVVLEKGNIEKVAEKIHNIIGDDLYKIEPVKPYPFSYTE